jgi:ppGpp synthetase/RelA/SpoT-type nucleotidyltranferase
MKNSKSSRNAFLKRYYLTPKIFDNAGLSWSELMSIYKNHESNYRNLEMRGRYIYELLEGFSGVHIVKMRVKNPKNLIRKIVLRTIDGSIKGAVSCGNYSSKINDLIGLRIIHMYKHQWLDIHKNILSTCKLHGKPEAHGFDDEKEKSEFEKHGLIFKPKEIGYRSIHYTIEFPNSKKGYSLAEIQVRTLCDEAWGEVDHDVRYPDKKDSTLDSFMKTFNLTERLADEMSTFSKYYYMLKFEKDFDYVSQKEYKACFERLKRYNTLLYDRVESFLPEYIYNQTRD